MLAIPPWRTTFRSSMLSAPATIPATIALIFPAGFDPTEVDRWTFRATIPGRSHNSANRITGSRPAHDTRFGSSKDARTTGLSCRNLIPQVPSRITEQKRRQLLFSQFRGHLYARHTRFYRSWSVDRGSVISVASNPGGPVVPVTQW